MRDQEFVRRLEESFSVRYRLQAVTGFIGNFPADQVPAHFFEGKGEHWKEVFENLSRYFGQPEEILRNDQRKGIKKYFWVEPEVTLTEIFRGSDYFFIIFPR